MLTIQELRTIAKGKNGKCLSEEYIDCRTKLLWECEEGHQWKALPYAIKQGSWCPKCGRIRLWQSRRLSNDEMHQIAEQHGGQCLSEKYMNNEAKLLWECINGHRWEADLHSVKRGTWCPVCAGVQRHTIEQMNQLAEAKGGKCLSEKYINAETKLQWVCAEGHRWKAIPSNVIRGHWCPKCSKRFGGNPWD